ncbi:Fc.00g072770.m01.CDS01 [Cosmosporella sp. VM-42]
MRFDQILLATCATAPTALGSKASGCPKFPSSIVEFSAGFKQPEPPLIKSEFKTNFVQHKWNQNLSHITTGYINNSPSQGFVRADEASNGSLASSLFNYANVTKEGLVDNTLTTYNPSSSKPDVWRGYVNSNFPIFGEDILIQAGAVFVGLDRRNFIEGQVTAWSLMYQGVIPVTVYVNNCNVLVGYDYFAPGLRTRAITEFFNIQVGA